jgi:hypothetical protein
MLRNCIKIKLRVNQGDGYNRRRLTHLSFVTMSRLDVIHDIYVNIVEDDVDAAIGGSLLLIHYIPEDDSSLSG